MPFPQALAGTWWILGGWRRSGWRWCCWWCSRRMTKWSSPAGSGWGEEGGQWEKGKSCSTPSKSKPGSLWTCGPAQSPAATYLGSSISSTKKDIDTRLIKAWTAINRLSIIWKSDLTDKMKRSFFQAAVVSILLYGCTTWMLTKKKLDGNYTRMVRAILNESWR